MRKVRRAFKGMRNEVGKTPAKLVGVIFALNRVLIG
ncbi:hypothetical protein DSM3645_13238 [Blastopirellula marina DSM 3645]|uniref:Uncharacterized protein n=1 Tax=Blastopirellula marina DSM 3645 TaxID=314230 RepID=A4A2I5_9BACT|nr:hypothetical protein DSM3645_13238 [Blastopirellula marina DSM 3645]